MGGHSQLAYTWSIPAVPPSLQVATLPFMCEHRHLSRLSAYALRAVATTAVATTAGNSHQKGPLSRSFFCLSARHCKLKQLQAG